jgi:hypothetical protein
MLNFLGQVESLLDLLLHIFVLLLRQLLRLLYLVVRLFQDLVDLSIHHAKNFIASLL